MIDTCYVGDVRDGLRAFIAAGVRAQTCVTSPPYWGLRDYVTAQWDGGDADCDHAESRGGPSKKQDSNTGTRQYQYQCKKCAATRIDRQLGLEPTPAEYVANMIEVFRLVRDVLADDGTLWLNIGDSYATGAGGVGECPGGGKQGESWKMRGAMTPPNRLRLPGLKPKDLVGIPWRLAFALQADGWYLRSDIIWHKPNPMPESVTDRPTKAHEYLFLLTKSERYYYDAAAIAEPAQIAARRFNGGHSGNADRQDNGRQDVNGISERNRRTVWTVGTEPFSGAHFAVMPTALVEPCVLAGSRVGDIVLDPFMGSGTVAQVAQSLGRRWIGCELNPEYVKLQARRTAQRGLDLVAAD